ncbi:hypothetical protein R6Q57_024382 [Mikania cordata]
MAVEAQIKEDIMGEFEKIPSSISVHGEKEEEDDYYSYSDSVDEMRSENSWSDSSPQFQDIPTPKFSLAVDFLKRLHGLVVQKKGGAALDDLEWQDSFLCNNDLSFPNDPTGELPNSWGAAEALSFHIRGATYLKDRKKVKVKGTLLQLVAANMMRSTNKQDDLAGRAGSICQGPWIVKQSVGNRPCLLGQVLKIQYVRGKNYLELDVDVGSSVIAKKVANRVVNSFSHLIVEAAFLIQGNTPEELPEHLLGTCQVLSSNSGRSIFAEAMYQVVGFLLGELGRTPQSVKSEGTKSHLGCRYKTL